MLHKEGKKIIGFSFLFFVVSNLLAFIFITPIFPYLLIFTTALLVLVLQFFRNPVRKIAVLDNNIVYSPADGKVVVIERTKESEYFGDDRIQVSVFMSPLNVHVNRNPVGGIVKFFRYHAGLYLVAWHPKASTDNERTTTVIDTGKAEILFRQIAGAVARRIVAYVKEGQQVKQGEDMGFIKFGSRVDIFLPLDAKIEVNIDQVVKGNQTVLARLS
ncbi:MAG: phosphatidylserine decarboxylase family protein [Saprospiraceae bacterium]